jgi:hypothetical protein
VDIMTRPVQLAKPDQPEPAPVGAIPQGSAAWAKRGARSETAYRVVRTAAAQIVAHPERKITTTTTPHGDIFTIPEQYWCAGHPRPEWPEDVTHASAETSVRITLPSGEDGTLLSGWLLQYPYALTDSEPVVAIALPGGDVADYDEAGLDRLAAELRAAADWAENLRDQLAAAKASSR